MNEKLTKEEIKEGVKNMTEDIEKGALVVVEENKPSVVTSTPFEMMERALTGGIDLATVEKMMDLQDRHNKNEAKKAYIAAMAQFKKTPISITKDKVNTQYKSKYSSIGATVNPCLFGMGECGLSHKWEFDSGEDNKYITGKCVVTHSGGHSDSVSMKCPIDTSGAKNPIQQIKSTRTYIKIETFTSIMGLTSSDSDIDDDGNSSEMNNDSLPDDVEKELSIIENQTDVNAYFQANKKKYSKWFKQFADACDGRKKDIKDKV